MKKILIILLFVLTFGLIGCDNKNVTTKVNENKTTKAIQTTKANVTTKAQTTISTTTAITKPTLGSKELPLTAGEAVGYVLGTTNAGVYSDKKGFVTGVVKTLEYNSTYKSYTIKITTDKNSSSEFQIFSGTFGSDVKSIHIGDTIVATGYYYNYNGETAEMTGSSDLKLDYPVIISVEHQSRTVTIGEHENAIVTELSSAEALCGSTITFKVTPNAGYEIHDVKINGVKAFDTDGVYSYTIEDDSTIVVNAVEEGTVTTIGTLESPKSVIETIEIIDGITGDYSDDKAYVKGIVNSVVYDSTYSSYNLYIHDESDTSKIMQVFGGTLASSMTEPHVGDTIIAFGYLYLYKGYKGNTYEVTGDSSLNLEYPSLEVVDHKERNITIEIANGVVNGLLEKYECGITASFTVSPNEGYKIYKVSVNGNVITATSDTYSFIVTDDTLVKIQIIDSTEDEPEVITVTKTVNELATANGWEKEKKYLSVNLDDVVTIEYIDGSSNTGKYYLLTKSSPEDSWRIYATEGAKIKIIVKEGYELAGFKYTRTKGDKGGLKGYSAGTMYSLSGTSITIPAEANSYISGFTVSYIKVSE